MLKLLIHTCCVWIKVVKFWLAESILKDLCPVDSAAGLDIHKYQQQLVASTFHAGNILLPSKFFDAADCMFHYYNVYGIVPILCYIAAWKLVPTSCHLVIPLKSYDRLPVCVSFITKKTTVSIEVKLCPWPYWRQLKKLASVICMAWKIYVIYCIFCLHQQYTLGTHVVKSPMSAKKTLLVVNWSDTILNFEAVTSKSQLNSNLGTHAMEPYISAKTHCWFSPGLISPIISVSL